MDSIGSKWQVLFFSFILWGLLIYLVFRLFNYGLNTYLQKKKYFQSLSKSTPIIEIIAWLLYFGWWLQKFYEAKTFFVLIVIGILALLLFWLSKYWLKDLIAGIVFKSTKQLKEGDTLQVEELNGVIKKFLKTTIVIESKGGQTIILPYSNIIGKTNIKSEDTEKSYGFSFELKLAGQGGIEIDPEEIRAFIISLPWNSTLKPPIVNLVIETMDDRIFDVTVFPIDKSYYSKIERHVKSKFT
ncbi:MAG: mechanosensitive ion channel [Bacteroidales bacterium]